MSYLTRAANPLFKPKTSPRNRGTFNPKVAGSRPARPIKEVPAHRLLPHVGNDVLGRWMYGWVYGNRPRQTGKAPSILAAWSFRSARSQWP
jgi:hypothetical protein